MPRPLSIEEARQTVLAACPEPVSERVAVAGAALRVLTAPVLAGADAPPFDSSAMDGFAVGSAVGAAPLRAGTRLRLLDDESRAGSPASRGLGRGEAMRISTGGAVPTGAVAVVRQEDTRVSGEELTVLVDVEPGRDVRRAGEDLRAGATVLESGTRLTAFALAAAISAGAAELRVARRPALKVVTTGDELREAGDPLGPGQIHNSNGPMLTALAAGEGAGGISNDHLPDDAEATEQGLGRCLAEEPDVILLSGGVSVGPHDHVKPALVRLGVRERFWRVALRPGGPLFFGTFERGGGRRTLVFGLPGNPVSTAVTFALFVSPAIAALQGALPVGRVRRARLQVPVARLAERDQAIRVLVEADAEGRAVAAPTGPQGSHIISSLLNADALAIVPRGDGELPAGSPVELVPLPGLPAAG